MCIVETLLVFAVATFHLAVVGRVYRDKSVCAGIPSRAAVSSKRVERIILLLEKRLFVCTPLCPYTAALTPGCHFLHEIRCFAPSKRPDSIGVYIPTAVY